MLGVSVLIFGGVIICELFLMFCCVVVVFCVVGFEVVECVLLLDDEDG